MEDLRTSLAAKEAWRKGREPRPALDPSPYLTKSATSSRSAPRAPLPRRRPSTPPAALRRTRREARWQGSLPTPPETTAARPRSRRYPPRPARRQNHSLPSLSHSPTPRGTFGRRWPTGLWRRGRSLVRNWTPRAIASASRSPQVREGGTPWSPRRARRPTGNARLRPGEVPPLPADTIATQERYLRCARPRRSPREALARKPEKHSRI